MKYVLVHNLTINIKSKKTQTVYNIYTINKFINLMSPTKRPKKRKNS